MTSKFEIKKVYVVLICEIDGEERIVGIAMPESVVKVLKKEVDSL